MTLINLFRRYERWNPVHPTYGAFWGIGFGVGCGVGWGPGFGPEVIGYVGAGCGIGLSVGVTLLGVGIGLPAGGLACVPSDFVSYASTSLYRFTRSSAVPVVSSVAQQGWNAVSLHALDMGTKLRSHCKLDEANEWHKLSGAWKHGWDGLNGRIQELQRSSLPRLKASADDKSTSDSSQRK